MLALGCQLARTSLQEHRYLTTVRARTHAYARTHARTPARPHARTNAHTHARTHTLIDPSVILSVFFVIHAFTLSHLSHCPVIRHDSRLGGTVPNPCGAQAYVCTHGIARELCTEPIAGMGILLHPYRDVRLEDLLPNVLQQNAAFSTHPLESLGFYAIACTLT